MRIIAIVIIMMLCMPLAADYSSLTEHERTDLVKALGMSIEYKIILEGKETHRIEEIVRLTTVVQVRLLLIVDKPDGGVRDPARPVRQDHRQRVVALAVVHRFRCCRSCAWRSCRAVVVRDIAVLSRVTLCVTHCVT